jgi:hypothetical protein
MAVTEREAWDLWLATAKRGVTPPFDPTTFRVMDAPPAVEARIMSLAREQDISIGRGATVTMDGHRYRITGPGVLAGSDTQRRDGLRFR